MRLLVISPFLDRYHGTELCIIEQIERFARQDHWSIELYSQAVSQVKGVRLASEVPATSSGSILWHKVPDIPGPHLFKYVWWFLANQCLRWWDRRSGKIFPDLVYSPGINCLDADVIVVQIVFHEFHARAKSQIALKRLPMKMWPRAIHRKIYYALIMYLERRLYGNPHVHLVAVSEMVAEQLRRYFRSSNVTVIPNAVDTDRFTPAACSARRKESRQTFGFSESELALLLIGNDLKKKGLDSLLRALAQLQDLPLRLLVVGSDDPGFYDRILKELDLQRMTTFVKPSADVLKFFSAVDLYVGPSLEDGFNIPILEAMACGLPVIASATAGVSQMIRDGETGFILRNPRDHTQLANFIRRIYSDRSLRMQTGEAASRYVLANCGWDENAERTRELLENTLQQMRKN